MTGSEFELLLRHFEAWAAKKQRTPDLDLLEELLHLRSAYDDLAPTYWPEQSVEHLLAERWPAKGPVEAPEPEVVVETLDSFVRFLRSTGRMSAWSAAPAALAKEAKRHVKHLAEASGDRSQWSFGKVLLDFGRSQGFELDDAPDLETLQERLAEVQEAWNALPVEERRALSPGVGVPPADDDEFSGKERVTSEWGIDDPLIALVLTFADRFPAGDLDDETVVAPYVRDAAYGARLLALARWVGDGKEVTATGVLRPALAREGYAELDLGDWQRAQLEREYPDERLPGVAAVGRDRWIADHMEQTWRSAADCEELHRLWVGALACGLLRREGRRVVSSGEGELTDERWVDIGVRSAVGLALHLEDSRPFLLHALAWAMLESYVEECRPVRKERVLEFLVDWTYSPRYRDEWSEQSGGWEERLFAPTVDEALGLLADTGLYVLDDTSLHLTPFGDLFVTAWLQYLAPDE